MRKDFQIGVVIALAALLAAPIMAGAESRAVPRRVISTDAALTEIVARLKRLITTHPAKQWTDELVLEHGGWEGLHPAFVHCVGQQYRMSSDDMVGPARGPGWEILEGDWTPPEAEPITGHDYIQMRLGANFGKK